MATKSVSVTIEGIAPLLMHAFPLTTPAGVDKMSPEEQAELSAYRTPGTNELYVPGINIQRCLVASATYSKGKGRGSLQKPVAACVLVNPERCGLGTTQYEIDSRPVVVPATKGRIVRHRPRLDQWSLSFVVEYDPTLLTANQLRQVVDDAGSRVGLLDFRPERKGPFGRFQVAHWVENK